VILVPVHMLGCPCDGRFLKSLPDCLKQIMIFLAALGQEIHSPQFKGSGVITSNKNGSLGNPMVMTEAIDQSDNGVETCQFRSVGVSLFDGTRDLIAPHNSVSRVSAFDDECRSAKGAAQGSITHRHGYTSTDCHSNGPIIVLNHRVLHRPVARAGEGLEGFVQRGGKRPFNLGNNEAFSEQMKGKASDSNRNPHTGGWGRVQRGPITGEATLLVVSWQDPPFPPCQIRVPFKDVARSWVQPPCPFCADQSCRTSSSIMKMSDS